MLSCKDVTEYSDEFLDHNLRLRKRLAMKMHLLICVHCRRYLRQLKALIRAVPFMHPAATDEEVAKVMAGIQAESDNT